MKNSLCALVGASLCIATTAQAVEVTGGSVQLKYSAFTEETDFDRVNIEGSLEIGFNRSFSTQIDLGHNNFGVTDADGTNFGLHGIYHVNETTSLGAFYTREDIENTDLDFFGVEAGFELGAFDFEGYVGSVDGEGDSETAFGLGGRYGFGSGFGVSLDYEDVGDSDVASLSTTTITLDKDVGENLNLFVELGSAEVESAGFSESEAFVGIGGRYVFGADRGATFKQRGLLRIIPGL